MMRKTCLPLLRAWILHRERCRKRAFGANFDHVELRMIEEIDILMPEVVTPGRACGYINPRFSPDAENVQGIFHPKSPTGCPNAQNF